MNQKMIMFDFADTIAELSPLREVLVQDFILMKLNIKIPLNEIKIIHHYVSNILFYSSVKINDNDDKKQFYIKFNQSILSFLGLSHLLEGEDLFNYFKANKQHWVLKDNVKELLIDLKSKDNFVCLVSNFDTRLNEILKDMNIFDLFDSVYISQEVGLEKPDIDFFKLALRKYNMNPKDCFFIGDSYLLDFVPSNSLLINSILLDESSRYSFLPESNRIANILDCKKIIFNK